MKKEIIITDKVHPLLVEGLKSKDFNITYEPKMPYEEVCGVVDKFDGIIINSKVICDKTFLDNSSHLDFIGRLGSGLDIIDLDYAKKLNIEVISSPEGNAHAVGEHSLAMLLGLMNNINKSNRALMNNEWVREPNRGTEIEGKVIGIIGFGHTGPAFAQKLGGLGVDILVYDKYRVNYDGHQVIPSSLGELLSKSDIVSINLPLTNETFGLINEEFINNMKHGAILINTSRGKIAKSSSILKALGSGQLGGVCLDVLENEKPETWTEEEKAEYSQIINHPNAIITPHIAGWTHQSLELIASILLEKICNFY